MSRIQNAVGTGRFLENYIADVGVTMIFGLGYYLFKSLKKKTTSSWSDPVDNLKTIKGKLEGALERWQYAKTIEEYHELIKTNYEGINDPFAIINLMNKNGILPTIETYNALLLNCLITDNNEFAEQLKDEMLDITGPVNPNVYTLNVLIKGLNLKFKLLLSKRNNPNDEKERENLFAQFDRELISIIECIENRNIFMDVMAQNTILECLVDHGRLGDAWNQFTNMKRSYTPDLFTYTTMLRGIKNTPELPEDWLKKAFQILEEAKTMFELDESFFNSLLDSCVKFNRIDKAEELFNEMKEKKGSVSEYSYYIMIKGYGKIFKLEKAYEMFNKIKALNQPNTITYGAMLNACIRCKNIELAESLVEEMTSKNIEKNLYIYSTMINGYRKTKKIGKAIELYDYLVNKLKTDDSVKLNTVFFNSILDCCVDSNKYDKMNEIFTCMQEKSSEDKEFPQIDLITYSIVMKGYAKSDSIAKVNEIYSYIRTRKDFILDEVLYNTILDCYARHNDEENLVKVFKDMKTNCVKASLFTYGVLIKLYFNIGNCNKAFELFDELVKSETKPNAAIYQMLIKLQLKSNLIERAITMFKNMLVNNIKADNIIYELIIKACFENDHAKEGSEFMLGSIKDGIKLERTIYELFINSLTINSYDFKHIEKYELLENLFTAMQDKSMKIDYDLQEKLNSIHANLSTGYRRHNNIQQQTIPRYNKDYQEVTQQSIYEESIYSNKNNNNNRNGNSNGYNYNKRGFNQYNNTPNNGYQNNGYRNNQPRNNYANNSNRYEERSIYS